MKQFDSELVARLEERVTAVEDDNALEVVVRVVPQSGHYRDAHYLWGAIAALLTLTVATYAPFVVEPTLLPVELLVIGVLAGLLSRRWWALTRLVTSATRRADQVVEHSRACFVEQAVSGTRGRTGVLVYVSLLEDLIAVVPDHGAVGAAPLAEWEQLSLRGRHHGTEITARLEQLLEGIEALGDAHLPSDGSDNPDELPNRPVIGPAGGR